MQCFLSYCYPTADSETISFRGMVPIVKQFQIVVIHHIKGYFLKLEQLIFIHGPWIV